MTLVGRKFRLAACGILFATTALLLLGVIGLVKTRARSNCSDRAGAGVAYKLSDGPYAVLTLDQAIHDSKRKKDLPVRILTPKSGGPFPVIVFSHGAGGSGKNYFPLTGFWATHGYVVIQPTHDDSIALRREKGTSLPSGARELIDDYRFNSMGGETAHWMSRLSWIRLLTWRNG